MNQSHQNKLNPKIQRLFREFEEAWKRQDFQQGISLLGQAIGMEPSNPGLHLNLARAYGERYDYAAVERCIEKALEVSQGNVQMIQEAARICSNFKHLDMMMRYLERASGKKGVSIPALTSLADLYVLDERLDEAAEMVERAARMDRKHPRVLLGDAVLKRKRGQIKEAESVLRGIHGKLNRGYVGPCPGSIRLGQDAGSRRPIRRGDDRFVGGEGASTPRDNTPGGGTSTPPEP